MTDSLTKLLVRLSEVAGPALLWGRQAKLYLGREFDRQLAHGILIEQRPTDEWDVCLDCDCGRTHRPIQRIDGQLIATCAFDRAQDVRLDDLDLRSFLIDRAAMVRTIADASGFAPPSELGKDLWHLGSTAGPRGVFLAFSGEACSQPGIISLMQRTSGSAAPMVLAPDLPIADRVALADVGFTILVTEDCIGDTEDPWRLDLTLPTGSHETEPRLVILRSRMIAVLDGRELSLPQQPFDLLVLLAEAALGRGRHVKQQEIERVFRGRSPADLVRDLRKALGTNGKTQNERRSEHPIVVMRRSPTRYALALAPGEIELHA
jgi:hypothetical protein